MQRSPVVVGLAAVFVGLTTLLLLVAIATGSPVVLVVALPLGVTAAIMWYHASGRLAARTRRRARAQAGRGAPGDDGPVDSVAGGWPRWVDGDAARQSDGGSRVGPRGGVAGDEQSAAGSPPPGWYEDADGNRWFVDPTGTRWRVGPEGGIGERGAPEAGERGAPGADGRGAPSGGRRGATAGGRRGSGQRSTGRRPPTGSGLSERRARERLGVDADADEDAIRRAYREKVKEVHPDADDGDTERFKAVTEAYERLVE